jgi:hypothetical protein
MEVASECGIVVVCRLLRSHQEMFLVEESNLRLMEKPIAVPQATGRSMAAAGLEKRKVGKVREGMYEVMVSVNHNCQN